MSLLTASRTAQSPLVADFTFNFDDTMVDTSGATNDFGETNIAETTVMIIPLPPGATVTGGSVTTSTAFDTAGYLVEIGDATTADRYLGSTEKFALGVTALVPTGYVHESGENIELQFTNTDVCTTGVMTVRVEYVVAGRSCEVQIA